MSDGQASGAGAALRLPDTVQTVDFVSDLHLNPALPATVAAFFEYLQRSRADTLVLLGDVFEAWVGDDSLGQAFEHSCARALHDFSRYARLLIMRGNRDFLLGPAFFAATGAQDLPDPTSLSAFGETVLLSHGDALCVADTAYQSFRSEVRQAAWQQAFLAQPLDDRLAMAQRMREASQAHQRAQAPVTWADVDPALTTCWLNLARATVLVHGHTHRPGSERRPEGWTRHVLSDWDLDHARRAEVLRWTAAGFSRLAPRGRVTGRRQSWWQALTSWQLSRRHHRHAVPEELWQAIIAGYPFLVTLPPADLDALHLLVSQFLGRKEFTGVQGLVVTDAMAVAVAAQACLPILRLGLSAYDDFVGIVIHPDEVVARRSEMDEDGVVHEFDEPLTGEAMQGGPVMLSWSDVAGAGESADDGYNVVIHEFAHVLDMRDGVADGIPLLATTAAREAWTRVLDGELAAFQQRVDAGEETGLDPYGAEGPEEFFAVASEVFFVAPHMLLHEHPALYELLAAYYRQDPAARS